MFSYFELTRKKDGAMMAEDVSFCHRVNEMGMETWIYPWAKTVHHGNCEFPLDFSKNPREEATIPLPKPDNTPPNTNTYFTGFFCILPLCVIFE